MLGGNKELQKNKNEVRRKIFESNEKKRGGYDSPEMKMKKTITPKIKSEKISKPVSKDNIFNTLQEKTEKKKYKVSGNAADFTPDNSTNVNPKNQKRVNKVLGR